MGLGPLTGAPRTHFEPEAESPAVSTEAVYIHLVKAMQHCSAPRGTLISSHTRLSPVQQGQEACSLCIKNLLCTSLLTKDLGQQQLLGSRSAACWQAAAGPASTASHKPCPTREGSQYSSDVLMTS